MPVSGGITMKWLKNYKNLGLYFLWFLLVVFISSVQAETLFEVKPDNIPYFKENKILALWNPKKLPEIREPGLKIFFFGKAEGCAQDAQNGKVEISAPSKKVEELIGLRPSPNGKVFTPIQEERYCDIKGAPQKGGSFVYINEDAKDGGIGLYTASGYDEKGESYFFTTRDEEGIGGGVNKFNKGSFVTWKLKDATIFPFKNNKTLKVKVISSVQKVSENVNSREEPVQVDQQFIIGFANKNCLSSASNKVFCQFKYMYHLFVKRWGGKLVRYENARIFIDKGQGGMRIISAFAKPSDEIILEKETKMPVMKSCGEGLYYEIFKDKEFCYIITWEQFQNTLKIIAANYYNKNISEVILKELTELFGKTYKDPNDWYLTIVNIAQELYDPYKDKNVNIGGNIKRIEVVAQ